MVYLLFILLSVVQAEEVSPALSSPRASLQTFLSAMEAVKSGQPQQMQLAISTLDLSQINPLVRKEKAPDLAWLLLELLQQRAIQPQQLPEQTDQNNVVLARLPNGALMLSKQKDGAWRFDPYSLAQLEKMVIAPVEYSDYLPFHLKIRSQLPDWLNHRVFLLANWQWLGLFIIVILGVILDLIFAFLLKLGVRLWRQRSEHVAFRDVPDDVLRPLGLMMMALVWWAGLNLLGLPQSALLILLLAAKFLASFSGVWTAYRLVDIVHAWLAYRAQQTENRLDDALVPMMVRSLKIFVTLIGIIFIADNLNINVTSLLAGLGLGGLAMALAAKDMVQNLFGSLTVLMDRTFTVGDWIIIDGKEGTVEQIGFRSTKLRTFYNSVLTIPNSQFITATVDNMGARKYRRLSTKLGIAYHTPAEKIEAFCEGIREIVRLHPYMRKDYYQVYFHGYGDSALQILVYVFWQVPDWSAELRERHRFLLDIKRLADRLGIEFAYPTRSLYLHQQAPEYQNDQVPVDEIKAQSIQMAKEIAERNP